jgi:hypothetical protein
MAQKTDENDGHSDGNQPYTSFLKTETAMH